MTGQRAIELARELAHSEQLAGRFDAAAILQVLIKIYQAEVGEEVTEKILVSTGEPVP